MNCLRCETELTKDSSSVKVSFYSCKNCGSQYTKGMFKGLVDRWLMPITLPLYSIIFEKEPEEASERVAKRFIKEENIEIIKEHILEELGNPKQKVSNIHDFICKDEEKIRAFLKGFISELNKLEGKA